MNIPKSVFTFQNNKKCFSILNGSDLVKKYFLISLFYFLYQAGAGPRRIRWMDAVSSVEKVELMVASIIQTFHWRPFQQLKHLT